MDEKSGSVVGGSEASRTLGGELFRVARALTASPRSASEVVAEALRSGGPDRLSATRALRKAIARRDETPEGAEWRVLPPSERDALALRTLGDLRGADLASVLGVPEADVERRLHHSLAGLAGPAATSAVCVSERGAWSLSGAVGEHGVDCDDCRDYRHVAQQRLRELSVPLEGAPTPDDEAMWEAALQEPPPPAVVPESAVIPGPVLQLTPPVAPKAPVAAIRKSNRGRAITVAAIGSVVLLGGSLLGRSAIRSHQATVASTVLHVDAAGPNAESASFTAKGKSSAPVVLNTDLRDGVVRTDARGFVRFSRGEARYLLDRASSLTLGEEAMHLTDGSLLVRDDKAIKVRAGAATISGEGEVQLTVLPDRTHVRVLRGFADVSVQGRAGKERVEVGQEGLLRDGHLEVASASGPSLRLAESREAEAERPLVGIGELIARKPGSKEEKDGAVVLRKHAVKTRIAGAMARTEIEEEFENKTDEVLEGVVRFPLPPGAVLERLALDVDGKLVEGEFVERKRAAAIFTGAICRTMTYGYNA